MYGTFNKRKNLKLIEKSKWNKKYVKCIYKTEYKNNYEIIKKYIWYKIKNH